MNLKQSFLIFKENLKNKNLSKIFIYNLLTSGLILAGLLTFLELISYNINYIEIFAFFSASFFIINLFQFYTVSNNNMQGLFPFIIQSILGGIAWVFYAVIMYFFYKLNLTSILNIILTFLTIIIISITHFYLVIKLNFFKNFY